MTLRFSILIPSHNHARFIAAAIDSCLQQDFPRKEFEIVVVEDGSTDESMEVLEPYALAGEITLLLQDNRGQAAAFAVALEASRGEFVCLLDADDTFSADKLALVSAWIDGHEVGEELFLCHDLAILDQERGQPLAQTWLSLIGLHREIQSQDLRQLATKPHRYPFAVPAGQILRRRTLERALADLPADDWRRGADNPIGWGALLAAGTVHYLHQPLATYRVHDSNGFIAVQGGRLRGKVRNFVRGPRLHGFIASHIARTADTGASTALARAMLDALGPLLLDNSSDGITVFVPPPTARRHLALEDNPLRTRDDVADLLAGLLAPLEARRSAGGARLPLGASATVFAPVVAEMEGFCRVLWGAASADAGGCLDNDWSRLREGLSNGVDPTHAEYWGSISNFDQRSVELAAIALALCLVPEQIWQPLPVKAKAQLRAYLEQINHCGLHANNWLFFRVLVNIALARLGFSIDMSSQAADLDRLESFAIGDGWYRDGDNGACDYYTAFAFHFYSLLYCRLAPEDNSGRIERFQQRARLFADQFKHWFSADGASIPFGRSLHYRFAAVAFWGALAYAGIEALPWGVIKGLYLRNLRWWLTQPMLDDDCLLTLGYTYPNLNLVEHYASPASPYWALKAFLPLSLPPSHPFWTSAECALPNLPASNVQSAPQMIITRDAVSDHIVLFPAPGKGLPGLRHSGEKYAKFCYSNKFGFSVPSAALGLSAGAHDNMLALSEEGEYFRVRQNSLGAAIVDGAQISEWSSWPDVVVRSWVVPAGFWHVRIHRVRTGRALATAEGGFALGHRGQFHVPVPECGGRAAAAVDSEFGISLIVDLAGGRRGVVIHAAPNTNVLHPNTTIPTLLSQLLPGTHWLACAVAGDPNWHNQGVPNLPQIRIVDDKEVIVANAEGRPLFRQSL